MDAFNLPNGKVNIALRDFSKPVQPNIQIRFTSVFTSKKQSDVASLVLEGLSNREIGGKLGVTEETVKFHLTNLFKGEGVKSRSEYIVKKFKEAIIIYGEKP